MSVLLFIDANQYLGFFGLNQGRKLLAPLEGQVKHIFLTQQIVDEVDRNKVKCAGDFFFSRANKICAPSGSIPDHLLGMSDKDLAGLRKKFGDTHKALKQLHDEILKLYANSLRKISKSQDELSKRLEPLFETAVAPTDDELKRARERKERGNPPGKHNNPLGDQITWEQLLTACKTRGCERLWVVSNDDDYTYKTSNEVFVNAFLHKDLRRVCGDTFEVYCFRDLLDALQHFDKNSGLKVEKMPSKKDSTKIREELDALSKMQPTAGTAPYFAGSVLALNVPPFAANATLQPLPSQFGYFGPGGAPPTAQEPDIETHDSE